jgi:hypothetical protein
LCRRVPAGAEGPALEQAACKFGNNGFAGLGYAPRRKCARSALRAAIVAALHKLVSK